MTSRSRRRVTAVTTAALAAMVAVGTLIAGCSSGSGVLVGQDRPGVATAGPVTIVPVAQRKPAPELSGTTLTGSTWSLSEHRGRVVVLNVWGSWCGPCQQEAPGLAAAARKLGSSATFIGLDTRDLDKVPPQRFVAQYKVPYPSLYDKSGTLLLGFQGQTSLTTIPSTLVIDPQGRVAARVLGAVDTTTLVGLVDDARG